MGVTVCIKLKKTQETQENSRKLKKTQENQEIKKTQEIKKNGLRSSFF
jgi:hypothetical protein